MFVCAGMLNQPSYGGVHTYCDCIIDAIIDFFNLNKPAYTSFVIKKPWIAVITVNTLLFHNSNDE